MVVTTLDGMADGRVTLRLFTLQDMATVMDGTATTMDGTTTITAMVGIITTMAMDGIEETIDTTTMFTTVETEIETGIDRFIHLVTIQGATIMAMGK